MTAFLTSTPSAERGGAFYAGNGLLASLRAALPARALTALLITSDPAEPARTAHMAAELRETLERSGFAAARFDALDGTNDAEAPALVAAADLIFLAGGHVPTQNAFFRRIGLRARLADYAGVVLGISAGSMNSAETVYAQPELPGESTDAAFARFLPGLGLTQKQIIPHYQAIRDDVLDGRRLFEDITYPDSIGREFFAIPDGSYLRIDASGERFFGEVWRIADGVCEKVQG